MPAEHMVAAFQEVAGIASPPARDVPRFAQIMPGHCKDARVAAKPHQRWGMLKRIVSDVGPVLRPMMLFFIVVLKLPLAAASLSSRWVTKR